MLIYFRMQNLVDFMNEIFKLYIKLKKKKTKKKKMDSFDRYYISKLVKNG